MGKACGTMECHGDVGKGQCNGFGLCYTMAELAAQATLGGDATALTYGASIGKMETWDAHMIRGCKCDRGYKMEPDGPINAPSYFCSRRPCATGDDPRTLGGLDEVQTATCTATAGTLTPTFRSKTTARIAYDAEPVTVMNALWALQSIDL